MFYTYVDTTLCQSWSNYFYIFRLLVIEEKNRTNQEASEIKNIPIGGAKVNSAWLLT